MSLMRRLTAFVALLAMLAGYAGVCAGWQATSEARMACCAEGNRCPMHASQSGDADSRRVITQAQADSCCAASEDTDPAPSPSPVGFVATLAVLDTPVAALVPDQASRRANELSAAPLPPARVPKHLLLSVFLV